MSRGDDGLGWIGHTIADRFAVDAVAGEGGFGIVYRGRHLGFDEPVAIKCLKLPAELTEEERMVFIVDFRDEARLLHRLSRQSAAIVQALDVGAATSPNGVWTPFIVMEWLEGCSLANELGQRRERGEPARSFREALQQLAPAAEALTVAHASGVAHLDVKPANLFVVEREPHLKVLDFGIAKVLSESDTLGRALTRSGAAMQICTPQYAAPEQFNQQHGPTGTWTDVFALALVLVEMLTSRPALDGVTALQLYVSALSQRARPRFSDQTVGGEHVEQALRRALEPNPTRRFRDAGTMWRALTEASALSDPRGTRSDPPDLVVRPRSSSPGPALPAATTMAATTTLHNRVCTVLFAEIVDEEGDATDPERQSRLLERACEALARCAVALEGTCERLVGDAVMACFGLDGDSLTAAERAVHAALRMAAALGEISQGKRPLTLRVGINTGRVFLTRTTDTRLTPTGSAVRLAGRLQQAARSGEILIGRDTHREVVGAFECEAITLPAQSGDASSRKAYRVVAPARDHDARRLAATRDFLGVETRFVGRSPELEAMGGIIDGVRRERAARLVTIFGPAGVGRSRLLGELTAQLHDAEMIVFEAQCSPLYTQTSFALAAALLRARFHIHEDDPGDVVEQKLERAIGALRGDRDPVPMAVIDDRPLGIVDEGELIAQLATLLGARREEASNDIAADERSTQVTQRIAGALAALLRNADRPVAFVCDDVQWADGASLGLFEELLRRLRDVPLLMVCAAELSFFDRYPLWGKDDEGHARLELMPLARRHLEAMARDRLRKVEGSVDALCDRLADRAEGSPLALVEMLHLLVDAGVLETRAEGGWPFHEERLGELKLPTSVLGIVQARLDRLGPDALTVLCHAAVVGTMFWDGALHALDPTVNLDGLSRILGELRARRLVLTHPSSIFPDEQQYAFVERATQQVAYEMLGMSARRDLHLRVAQWLDRRLARDAAASLVAHHYEHAGSLARALDAYVRAGTHASALGQLAEALHAFEQAWRIDGWLAGDVPPPSAAVWDEAEPLNPPDWRERVKLALGLGDTLLRLGRPDEALDRYRQAQARLHREDADPTEPPRWAARVAYRIARVQIQNGLLDEPRLAIEQGIQDATVAGLVAERAELWALLAALHRRARDLDAARTAALSGLRVCRGTSDRSPAWRQAVSKLFVMLGGAAHSAGNMVRAERFYLWASRIIDENDNPDQLSRALNNLAGTRFARGDLKGARESFLRGLSLTDKSGDLLMRMISLANLGEVELVQGHAGVARGYLREAVRLGGHIGAAGDLTDCHRNLAAACLALGEQDAALAEALRALELAQVGGARRLYLASVLETLQHVIEGVDAMTNDRQRILADIEQLVDGLAREAETRGASSEKSVLRIAEVKAALAGVRGSLKHTGADTP